MPAMPTISLNEVSKHMPGGVLSIDMVVIAKGALRVTKASPLVGALRSSKPKNGESAYVWRMCAFMLSPVRAHQCMPMTADFDMPAPYWDRKDIHKAAELRRARCKELDVLVSAMVDSVPVKSRHGVNRWAKAFGY